MNRHKIGFKGQFHVSFYDYSSRSNLICFAINASIVRRNSSFVSLSCGYHFSKPFSVSDRRSSRPAVLFPSSPSSSSGTLRQSVAICRCSASATGSSEFDWVNRRDWARRAAMMALKTAKTKRGLRR